MVNIKLLLVLVCAALVLTLSVLTYGLFQLTGNVINGDVIIGDSAVNSYSDTGLNSGSEYNYSVKAYDASGKISDSSNILRVTTNSTLPIVELSIWNDSFIPAVTSITDSQSLELGMEFKVDFDSMLKGIKFYKGAGNTGVHTGHLWDSNGNLLASITFTGESSSGWQKVYFSSAVPISANTIYYISYYSPTGYYAVDVNGFNPEVYRNGIHGINGMYVYGSNSGGMFPTDTYQSSNYWVDVVLVSSVLSPPSPTTLNSANSYFNDGDLGISLNWTNVENETLYSIERNSTSSSFVNVANATRDSVSYLDLNGLNSSSKYCYRIRAYNSKGYSAYSNVVCATTSSLVAPGKPIISSLVAVDAFRVALTWVDVANESYYNILRSNSLAGTYAIVGTAPKNSVTYSDSSIDSSTTYYYKVRAVNSVGETDSDAKNVTTPVFNGKVYYVSTTGNDNNAGTSISPFLTIQKAANVVSAGDSVIVRAGTYAGFQTSASGRADAPITFKAEPGVILNTNVGGSSSLGQIWVNAGSSGTNSAYNIFDGFIIIPSGTSRWGISIESKHVSVKNCIIHRDYSNANSGLFWGIVTTFSDYVLLENNTIYGTTGQHGIYVADSVNGAIVRGNRIWDTKLAGVHLNGDKMATGDADCTATDGVIDGALIENNIINYTGVSGAAGGINGDGLINSVIRNNIVYGQTGNGIALYQFDGCRAPINDTIVGNTVIDVGSYAVQVIGGGNCNGVANCIDGNPSNIYIYDNILVTQKDNADGWGSGAIQVDYDSGGRVISDYNVVNNNFNLMWDGSHAVVFSDWKATTGNDLHSILVDSTSYRQLFSNYAGKNLHLSSNSAAKDSGVANNYVINNLLYDIDGQARPNGVAYDIGADEFY